MINNRKINAKLTVQILKETENRINREMKEN